MVPVPPEGPCHSTRPPGPEIWTDGSPLMSTRRVTGTPKASPILASVARLGLERPCSRATSTLLFYMGFATAPMSVVAPVPALAAALLPLGVAVGPASCWGLFERSL
jgi:hypothetical protein